jgi:Ser/Thr protein kinase RdoA (MazF antagonist)
VKHFSELTALGQVRRLRILAKQALQVYSLKVAKLTLVQHGENTTFRVVVPQVAALYTDRDNLYHPGRFLLRIHRIGYQDESSIASELMWLAALRQEGLPVPKPVPSQNGDLYTIASAAGVPGPRVCSLLRWLNGRFYENNPLPRHLAAVGRLMAHLHTQSAAWQPPAGFTRRSWDCEGLFGDQGGYNLPKAALWDLVPAEYTDQFREVATQTASAMTELDALPNAWGLIHADLHLGNVLFARNTETGLLQARPIDFDDCGYAHWIYDFAVVLGDYVTEETYPQFRDALLDGYSEIRPLPEKQLEHLNTFIAARLVSLLLWATDMAQINKGFIPGLAGWYAWASDGIRKSNV